MENKAWKVEVTTHGTYDSYLKFYRFSLFRGRLNKLGPAMFFIIDLIGILVSLLSGFAFGFDVENIAMLAVLIVLSGLMIFLIFIMPRFYYKSAKKLIEAETRYSFTEDGITIDSSSDLVRGSTIIAYGGLYKVSEIEDYIYIFISNNQAYIIPKKDVPEEDIASIREILKNRVNKYLCY